MTASNLPPMKAADTNRYDQFTIGNVAVITTTYPSQAVHYSLYLKCNGDDHILAAWTDSTTGRCKRINEIIIEAYQRVFMWIRPQMSNGLFIDNLNDRDLFLRTLNNVYMKSFGFGELLRHEGFIYQDERRMMSMDGTAKLFRTYDRITDCFTSSTILMPTHLAGVGVTRCDVTMSNSGIDPGDFIDGEWTPGLRDPKDILPIVDEPDVTNERPMMY